MGILSFKPTRSKFAPPDAPMVADLDALVGETVYFRYQGKGHPISPMSTEEYFRLMNKYSSFVMLTKNKTIIYDEFVDGLTEIFAIACPTIGREQVEAMTPNQRGSLLQLVIDFVNARVQGDTAKKKVTVPPSQLTSNKLK